MNVEATITDLQRAERVARAGAPYPYPSAAEARRAHQPAGARAHRDYVFWGFLWGAVLAVIVCLAIIATVAWRAPVLPFVVGGAIALVPTVSMLVPRWKTIGRHRAVLAAYGIPTSVYGIAVPDPQELAERHARAAADPKLREEARRGLQIYRRVIGFNIVLVVATWVVAAFALLPADGNPAVLGGAIGIALLLGAPMAWALLRAMGRVRAASHGTYATGKHSGIGVIVFFVAMVAGGIVMTSVEDLGATDLFRAVGTLFMIVLVTGRWVQDTLARMRRLRELGETVPA